MPGSGNSSLPGSCAARGGVAGGRRVLVRFGARFFGRFFGLTENSVINGAGRKGLSEAVREPVGCRVGGCRLSQVSDLYLLQYVYGYS